MKTRSAYRLSLFCALIFLFNSFLATSLVSANSPPDNHTINEVVDPGIIVRPGLPDGVLIPDLPSASSIGRKVGNCFASYLIEKVILGRSPDQRGIDYGIRVVNIGSCPLDDLVVTDFFPENTLFQGAYPRPRVLRQDGITWVLPGLGVGESAYFNLSFFLGGPIPPNGPIHTLERWCLNTACVWNKAIRQATCAWQGTRLDNPSN